MGIGLGWYTHSVTGLPRLGKRRKPATTKVPRKARSAPAATPEVVVAPIYAATTVRAFETNTQRRYEQSTSQELIDRFCKWVKVAVSRNASAVASTPLRLYRKVSESTTKSAWRTRRVKSVEAFDLARRMGAKAYTLADDGYEEITDQEHPVLRLLSQFNPVDNGYVSVETTEMHESLTGNGYWLAVNGANGWPVELYVLPPQFIRVVPDKLAFISEYIYGRGFENEQAFPPESIIHFKRPNPRGDPYYGLGDLAAVTGDADLSVAFTNAGLAMIDGGMVPSTIVTSKRALTREQRQHIVESLERKHTGVRKFGNTMILEGSDFEVTLLNMGEKEVAFLRSEDKTKEVIAAAFDVPVPLLSPPDSASLATAMSAIPHWQLMAIRPRLKRRQETLNQRLLPMFAGLGDPSLVLVYDDCVDKDKAAMSTQIQGEYGAGLITVNEARTALGWEPLEVGGDERKLEASVPAQGAPSGNPAGEQDSGLDAQGSEGRGDEPLDVAQAVAPQGVAAGTGEGVTPFLIGDKTLAAELVSRVSAKTMPGESARAILSSMVGVDEAAVGAIIGPAETFVMPEPEPMYGAPPGNPPPKADKPPPDESKEEAEEPTEKHAHDGPCFASKMILADISTKDDRSPSASPLDEAMRQFFRNLTPQVMEAVGPAGLTPAYESIAFQAMLTQATEPVVMRVFGEGYNAAAGSLGNFDVANTRAIASARAYTADLAGSVSHTVRSQVSNAIAAGLERGASTAEITADVHGVMTNITEFGAERIARTETSRAYNLGTLQAWKDTGVTRKRIVVSGAPCEICESIAANFGTQPIDLPFMQGGQSVVLPSGGSFTNDWVSIVAPPLHPNCRCSLEAIE